jgi:hypothetical protein
MALIYCPECKSEVSDKAEKCPKCAFPLVEDAGEIRFQNRKQYKRKTAKAYLYSFLALPVGGILMFWSQALGALVMFLPLVYLIRTLYRGWINERL